MEYILRETQTGGNKKNYIFSKSEVSILLKVSMFAFELDALLNLVYDSLDRSQKMKRIQKEILKVNAIHPHLRSLLPLVHVHSETAEVALRHATNELFGISRIINELDVCANDLAKCAE